MRSLAHRLWVFSDSRSTNSSIFWLSSMAERSRGAGLYPLDCKNGSLGSLTARILAGGLSMLMLYPIAMMVLDKRQVCIFGNLFCKLSYMFPHIECRFT